MKLFSAKKGYNENEDNNVAGRELEFEEPQYGKTKSEQLEIVENSCDQMIISQKRLGSAKKEYAEVNHYLTDISTIENLEGEKKENLLFEARRIESLKQDKKSYRETAVKMSEKKYEYIAAHEKEMPDILKELKENEDEFQRIKSDLHNIEGEKSALKYERKTCIQHMNALRKILRLILMLAAILLMVFAYGQYKGEYDYTIGFYVVIVITIAAIAVIFSYNKTKEHGYQVAQIKLNKAIVLLNRYKLRYVNMKSTLDYFYQMYGVANSYELSNRYRQYLTAKKEREAYFTMSDNLYKSMENYMNIINSLNLYDPSVWNYQTKALVNEEEMEIIKNTLHTRRETLRRNMDYNNDVINNSKQKIKTIIENNPGLSTEVFKIIDEKEASEI